MLSSVSRSWLGGEFSKRGTVAAFPKQQDVENELIFAGFGEFDMKPTVLKVYDHFLKLPSALSAFSYASRRSVDNTKLVEFRWLGASYVGCTRFT